MSERLLGIREAARRLGVHENTVRNWCDEGLLTYQTKPGDSGYRQIPESAVEEIENGVQQIETLVRRGLTEVRREWGVMFSDGSVRQQYNGRTAQKRATEDAEYLRTKYAPDNIRVVSRRVYVGEWEEPE